MATVRRPRLPLKQGTHICTAIDGLIVALSMQKDEIGSKKTWTRKVVLVTDGENPLEVDDGDLEGTVKTINDWHVNTVIMCVKSLVGPSLYF